MTIQAAQQMGLQAISLDPAADTPSSKIAPFIQGKLSDPEAIAQLLKACDHVTLENEFIPAKAIEEALRIARKPESMLTPNLQCLATIQDKLKQRETLTKIGVPTPQAIALTNMGEEAEDRFGFPMVLKARFGGYDGKGTIVAHSRDDLMKAEPKWGAGGWMAEEFVPFRRELAVMVARTEECEIEFETVETQQVNCVCDVTYPAALWNAETSTDGVPMKAVQAMNGFGLFGVELFELESGEVLVNEIAPRPHNTGHYSLNWGEISQFEMLVRIAVGLDFPVPTDGILKGLPVYMVNLFGVEGAKDIRGAMKEALAFEPSARIHWYDKTDARPGRKLGHINLISWKEEAPHTVLPHLLRTRDAFYEGWCR